MNVHPQPIKVLICPLDWGLGHATRCIPIIKELVSRGAEVIIAGDGYSLELLKQEFPSLEHIKLTGYQIKFSNIVPLSIKMLLTAPRILRRIYIEHRELNKLIETRNIDIVISDNRYGCWNKSTYSVFMTHQLNIIPPPLFKIASPLLRKVVRNFIKKYNECWIPDSPDTNNLSGALSHNHSIPANTKFIGVLSRFAEYTQAITSTTYFDRYDIIAILSGPEPHRSAFENILKDQLSKIDLKSIIIRGITGRKSEKCTYKNLTVINHLSGLEIQALLKEGPIVICRGGYSTLMDLAFTGNKIICVPTPGQSEQEYLAKKGHLENKLICCSQKDFVLKDVLDKVNKTTGLRGSNEIEYKNVVAQLLTRFDNITH